MKPFSYTDFIYNNLPELVTTQVGHKYATYQFTIHLKGSRGLAITYKRYYDWHGPYEASSKAIIKYNAEKFKMPSDSMIYHAEYIRSDMELQTALRNCRAFLRKHRLTQKKSPLRRQKKLFSTISNFCAA